MIIEIHKDDKHQLAPWLRRCDHKPVTDEEKWNNPQDNWCDECQAAVCRKCYEEIHQYHKATGREVSKKLVEDRIKNAELDTRRPKEKRGKPGVFETGLLKKFKKDN